MKSKYNPFLAAKSNLIAIALAFTTSATFAVDYTWNGSTGTYNNAASWGGTIPVTPNNAFVNAGTVQINAGDPAWTTWDIRTGNAANGGGAVVQNGSTLTSNGWFRMGVAAGSTGSYTLTSGTLNTQLQLRVGELGNGTFNIDGGTVNRTATTGDPITVGDRTAGSNSHGTINQTAGTVTTAAELWIGNGNLGNTTEGGAYNLSGSGILNISNWFAIGRLGGIGVFNMSGGTVTKTNSGNNITISTGTNGSGTVNQSGGTFTNTASLTYVGESWNGDGNGTWNLSNTGIATLGEVIIGNGGASKGTFNLNGGTFTAARIRTTSTGATNFNFNGGTLKPGATQAAFMAGLTAANVKNGGAIIDTNTFDIGISQSLLNGGTGGLTKNGTGTLTLSGANTFIGDTVINAGTLTVGSATALGGSTLNYNGQGGTLSFGTLAATTFGGLKGSQNIALTNASAGNVALTVGANNTSNTYTGQLSGGGSLIKAGTGTTSGSLTLPNANTFTGNVAVANGALIIANSDSLGTGAKTIEITNGTAGNPSLHLNGSGGSVNLPGSFTYSTSNAATVANSYVYTSATIINDAGTNSIAGQINMTAGGGGTNFQSDAGTLNVSANITAVTTNRSLIVQGAGNGSVSGVISDGSTVGLPVIKSGAGTWILSGLNTYTGATTIVSGVLQLGVAQSGTSGALGTDSAVTLANTAGAVLDLNGFNTTIGALSGGGALGGNVTLGSGTLTTGVNAAPATYGGVISGSGGLIKNGELNLTLTNANTYSGPTTVNSGTLTLDHSGANLAKLGETAVNVNGASGNATLQVNGNTNIGVTTAGNLTSNGTVSLNDSTINTLTLGGAVSLNGSILNVDMGTATTDQIVTHATGAVSGTNTVNFTLLPGQTVTPGNYTLITAPGGLGTGGSGFTVGTKPAGFYNFLFTNSTPTAVVLTISGPATPTTAYWTGKGSSLSDDSGSNNWSNGSLVGASNWSTTANGLTDPLQIPGATTDVVISATNAIPNGTDLYTQLDANYSIKGLTFNTPVSIATVYLAGNGNTLTLGVNGLTIGSTTNSIAEINGGGTIVLNGSQNWSNNSASQSLAVALPVSGLAGATTLTLNGTGAGGVTISGPIGNGTATAVGLVLNQAGVTTLSGNNTFTGGVTFNSGTLNIGNGGAFNSTTPNTLTFGAGSTGILRLNGNSVTVASLSTNATVGTPVIENAGSAAATLTDSIAAGNSTFAGLIQDGSSSPALSFTKAGAGSLVLTNQNTYTGATSLNGGTLTLGSGETPGVSGPLGLNGPINFGGGTLQYSTSNLIDYSARFSTAVNQQFKIDTNGQNILLTANLTSAGGSLQKYGAGALTVTGSNSTLSNVWTHAGALVIDNAAKITTTGYCSLGVASGDISTTTVQGSGQLLVTGDFNVSDLTGSYGVLNMTDTAAVKGSALFVGKSGNATGIVNQTNGSFTQTSVTGDWRIGGGVGAGDAAAVGIYNLSGGSLSTAGNFQIGAFGSGAMNISGGASITTTGGYTVVGRFAGGYGVLDVNGASVGQNTAGTALIVGEQGTGILNIRGGASVTSLGAGLYIGGTEATAGTVGIVNLGSGTLTVPKVLTGSAVDNSTLNFNGGILKANAASTTFLTGLTNAYVQAGGANIDANGLAITIGQSLQSPVGTDGVSAIAVTDQGSGYVTAPIVKITGGGGTGATAVATMSGGKITGITVTNPGVGYTSPPTVALITGLSGGAGATFSPTLAANASGNLNISSTTAGGVVTLTGASTYAGTTTINAGAGLQLGDGTTGKDGTITGSTSITDNGTLIYNRFGANSESQVISGTGALTKSGPGTQVLSAINTYTGVTTINGGVLSVADLENGGVNSSIGASTAASANLVFGGNGTLLYTGPGITIDRGYTVGAGGGVIDHANNLTIQGPVGIVAATTGSFTKNGTGTLNITNTTSPNILTGGTGGNNLGFVVNNGIVNLGGTPAAALSQTNTITGELILATINSPASPNVDMNINGGTTNVSSYIGVGRGNGTNNARSTLTLNNDAVVTGGNFAIGYDAAVGGYTSSPTVNFNGSSKFTDAGAFTVGESINGSGGVSTINLNDTPSVFLTNSTVGVFIGASGAAVVNHKGGSLVTANTITLARDATSTATYNFDGGFITTPRLTQGTGTGTFNFNGGTLKPSAPSTAFIQALGQANIRNGGAIIDTVGWNVTAIQAFSHSIVSGDNAIDGGLTKKGAGTLTLALANTYTGDTKVNGGILETLTASALGDASAVRLAAGTTMTLTFTGTPDTVGSLYIDNVQQSAGTWGGTGSGADHISPYFTGTGTLLVTNGTGATPFDNWATTTHGLSGNAALPASDPDADGYNNFAEFVIGGEPNPARPGSNSNGLAPTVAASGVNHVFSFRRSQLAMTQPGIAVVYEYGSALTGWTPAVNGTNGITITVTPNGYETGIDRVDVSIPNALGVGGKLFARFNATQP